MGFEKKSGECVKDWKENLMSSDAIMCVLFCLFLSTFYRRWWIWEKYHRQTDEVSTSQRCHWNIEEEQGALSFSIFLYPTISLVRFRALLVRRPFSIADRRRRSPWPATLPLLSISRAMTSIAYYVLAGIYLSTLAKKKLLLFRHRRRHIGDGRAYTTPAKPIHLASQWVFSLCSCSCIRYKSVFISNVVCMLYSRRHRVCVGHITEYSVYRDAVLLLLLTYYSPIQLHVSYFGGMLRCVATSLVVWRSANGCDATNAPSGPTWNCAATCVYRLGVARVCALFFARLARSPFIG